MKTGLNDFTQLNLRFLTEVGVPAKEVDRLRDQIFKSDQLALDMSDGVRWSRISSSAQTIGLELPTAMLKKIFAPVAADPIVINRVESDYPLPAVSRDGNDAAVAINSNKIPLVEGGGAKIYKKSMLEWLFLRRTKSDEANRAGFELHGFKTDKIAIDVPPGGTLVIVDAQGNQRGYGVRPAEITASLMGENTPFTIKVLDKARDVVLEQTFSFAAMGTQGSKKLIEGTFSKRAPDDQHPERPRFSVGDEKDVDRVVLKRDGKNYPIERYEQLLAPPRLTTQSFKAGNVTFMVRPHNGEMELDDPAYTWTKTARIATSDGHPVTMDWSLVNSRRAKWTADGFAIFNAGSDKPFAVFDPFFGNAGS